MKGKINYECDAHNICEVDHHDQHPLPDHYQPNQLEFRYPQQYFHNNLVESCAREHTVPDIVN